MVSQNEVLSRKGQQAQWMTSNVHLSAPELHDFSDLRSEDGQRNHMLRWVIAVATILVISHFAFDPSSIASRTQASINQTSATTAL
jgi:hypothetical protein